MDLEIKEIEKKYNELIKRTGKENIDFWGINIMEDDENMIFKIYQSQRISKNVNHPLIDFLRKRDMVRYYADVLDTKNPNRKRLDISLYQRNDENMTALFGYLLKRVPFFASYYETVKKVAKMKITDEEGYQFASIYHVGLIETERCPDILKFHFFTRWCEDPNQHTKEGYRDKEYLTYLKYIDVKEYQVLSKRAECILDKCDGHLWMAGMDLSLEECKYKIYLKEIKEAYRYLPEILGGYFEKQLKNIGCWNEMHKECRLAGAAVAMDSKGKSSLNLYYHVD